MTDFAASISAAYATEGEAIDLGLAVHEGTLHRESAVRVPLATMNRHGLVAGATGTGKTKTLQLLSGQLSRAGVPVLVADVKGDVSGLAAPGEAGGAGEKRMLDLGLPFAPEAFPVEFLALGGLGPGVPLRATVSDFGPQLLAKVLGANETQESSLVFHYADEQGLPLLDLDDLRALLTFLDSDAGKAELEGIGGLSSATVGLLLRSLAGLETGGGSEFFGEPQFDVADLLRTAPGGRGILSCLELAAVQDKPALWSTALMWLVAEPFQALPEAGVTQQPTDLSEEVLAQLGLRVQHALRAFTPADAKKLRATVSTYPRSEFYDVAPLLTSVGSGEAAITLLSEKGVPTPVVHTRMVAPASRMDPSTTWRAPPSRRRCGRSTASASTRRARARCSPGGSRRRGSSPSPSCSRRWSTCRCRAGARSRAARPRRAAAERTRSATSCARARARRCRGKVARGIFGMLRKRL
jgi:DNA helicase HerA-like ATPase